MSPLQVEILKVMQRHAECGVNELEKSCQLHRSPKQMRQDLGELIVNGYVEQIHDPEQGFIRGYRLTQLGGKAAVSQRFAS